MERFTLAQAAAWTHGEARGEAALTAVTTDSRQIPPEALFLPIKGERFDAHDFIGKAIENGAAAVMSHRENEEYPVPALYVENTSQALLDLAGGYRTMWRQGRRRDRLGRQDHHQGAAVCRSLAGLPRTEDRRQPEQ